MNTMNLVFAIALALLGTANAANFRLAAAKTGVTTDTRSNIRSSGAVQNSAEQAPHTVGPCSKCDNDDKGKFS